MSSYRDTNNRILESVVYKHNQSALYCRHREAPVADDDKLIISPVAPAQVKDTWYWQNQFHLQHDE